MKVGNSIWMMVLAARGDLRVWHLVVNGVIYVMYVAVMLA
jgi:hypothetical protein